MFPDSQFDLTHVQSQTTSAAQQSQTADCWNLASLCKSDAAWEAAFKKWEGEIAGYEKFAGHLGESAKKLAACLKFDIDFDRTGERLGTYAFLKTAEDRPTAPTSG